MAEASASNRLFAADALLPTGWARDVLLAWDAQGRLTGVVPASAAPAGVPRPIAVPSPAPGVPGAVVQPSWNNRDRP